MEVGCCIPGHACVFSALYCVQAWVSLSMDETLSTCMSPLYLKKTGVY